MSENQRKYFTAESYAPAARSVAELIANLAADKESGTRAVYDLFNGKNSKAAEGFRQTIREIIEADARYGELTEYNGIICAHSHQNGTDVIQSFKDICIDNWRQDYRPSLPTIAAKKLKRFGVDIYEADDLPADEKAVAEAIMLVSARAEMIRGEPPTAQSKAKMNDYHNTVHTAFVAEVAGFLAEKNNLMEDGGESPVFFSRKQQMLILLAALSHDVDHDGTGNPPDNPYLNEEKSFNTVKPLMAAAGMGKEDIEAVHMMLRVTSPNGPHAYLKAAAAAYNKGRVPEAEEIDMEGKFPELVPLLADRALLEMASILSDADLFVSAGAGTEASDEMSDRLTKELQKAGLDIDLRGDKPRMGFMDHIVSKSGFTSYAGRAAGNDNFEKMYAETQERLARAEDGPQAQPS